MNLWRGVRAGFSRAPISTTIDRWEGQGYRAGLAVRDFLPAWAIFTAAAAGGYLAGYIDGRRERRP